jgi:hypothetical protein
MEKFNDFLEKAPIWKIFVSAWFFTGLMVFIITFIFFNDGDYYKYLLVSAVFGVLFGGMFSGMISTARQSDKFWMKAKELEKLIDEANTKEDLVKIFENEYQSLKKLSMGGPHVYETRRIYTILETKYKYVNNDNDLEKLFTSDVSPEEEVLNKIKFVLSANNDSQAIRLIEQYGFWKEQNAKPNKPQLQNFINQFEEGNGLQELSDKDWTVSEFLNWLKLNNFEVIQK